MGIKSSQKSVLIIISVLIILAVLIYFLFIIKPAKEEKPAPAERTLEQILKEDLTAPLEELPLISEEVIESLTAPAPKEEVPENILENLTAPD